MKDYGMKPPAELLRLSRTKNKMKVRFLVWVERAKAEGPQNLLLSDEARAVFSHDRPFSGATTNVWTSEFI